MDPSQSTPLYQAANRLLFGREEEAYEIRPLGRLYRDNQEIEEAVREVISPATARLAQNYALNLRQKITAGITWMLRSGAPAAPQSPDEIVARKIVDLNLIEEINKLRALEIEHQHAMTPLVNGAYPNTPSHRVITLAAADSICAQKLRIIKILLDCMSDHSEAEELYEPAGILSLRERVQALEMKYQKEALGIRVEATKYSVIREIFNKAVLAKNQELPPIPAHQPTVNFSYEPTLDRVEVETQIKAINELLSSHRINESWVPAEVEVNPDIPKLQDELLRYKIRLRDLLVADLAAAKHTLNHAHAPEELNQVQGDVDHLSAEVYRLTSDIAQQKYKLDLAKTDELVAKLRNLEAARQREHNEFDPDLSSDSQRKASEIKTLFHRHQIRLINKEIYDIHLSSLKAYRMHFQFYPPPPASEAQRHAAQMANNERSIDELSRFIADHTSGIAATSEELRVKYEQFKVLFQDARTRPQKITELLKNTKKFLDDLRTNPEGLAKAKLAELQQSLSSTLTTAKPNDLSNEMQKSLEKLHTEQDKKWMTRPWRNLLINEDTPRTADDRFPSLPGFNAARKDIIEAILGDDITNQKKEIRDWNNKSEALRRDIERLQAQSPKIVRNAADIAKAKGLEDEIKPLVQEWRLAEARIIWLKLNIRRSYIESITNETGRCQALDEEYAADLARYVVVDPNDREQEASIRALTAKKEANLEKVKELNDLFVKQIAKYRRMHFREEPVFRNLFTSILASEGASKITENAATAFWTTLRRRPPMNPDLLQTKQDFALIGYTAEIGKKSISEDLKNPDKFYREITQEFITFANSHPEAASALIADMTLAASNLQGKNVFAQLTAAIDIKRTAQAILGTGDAKVKKADFKFLALAEFARGGNLPITVVQAIGNIIVAAIPAPGMVGYSIALGMGVSRAFMTYFTTTAVQNTVQGTQADELRQWSIGLNLASGVPVADILKEEELLANLEIAGTIKDVLLRPRRVFERIRSRFNKSRKMYELAWKNNKVEAVERFATGIAAPVAMTVGGVAAGLTAATVSGVLPALLLLGGAVLLIGSALALSRVSHTFWNWWWKDHGSQASDEIANEFIAGNTNLQQQLIDQRSAFLTKMKVRSLLIIPNVDRPAEIHKEHRTVVELRDEFDKALRKKIEDKKTLSRQVPPLPSELVALFKETCTDFDLHKKCEKFASNNMVTVGGIEGLILQPYFNQEKGTEGQMITWIDESLRHQLQTEITSYSDEAEFLRRKQSHQAMLDAAVARIHALTVAPPPIPVPSAPPAS